MSLFFPLIFFLLYFVNLQGVFHYSKFRNIFSLCITRKLALGNEYSNVRMIKEQGKLTIGTKLMTNKERARQTNSKIEKQTRSMKIKQA